MDRRELAKRAAAFVGLLFLAYLVLAAPTLNGLGVPVWPYVVDPTSSK